MNWSEIIQQYRQNSGESQGETAIRLGVSRNYVAQIERGEKYNLSFDLGVKVLNLASLADGPHKTITVTLSRRVQVDASLAQEVVWLNFAGVSTVSSCQGPPATILILPSSKVRAKELGYYPTYQEDIGLFEIVPTSSLPQTEIDA